MRRIIIAVAASLAALMFGAAPALADPSDVAPDFTMSVTNGSSDHPMAVAVDRNGDIWQGTSLGHLTRFGLDDQGEVDELATCSVYDSGDVNPLAVVGLDFDENGNAYIATGSNDGRVGVISASQLSACDYGQHMLMTVSAASNVATDVKVHGDYLYVVASADQSLEVYTYSPSLTLYAKISLDMTSPHGVAVGAETFAVVDTHGYGKVMQFSFDDVEGHGDTSSPPTLTPDPITTVSGTSSGENGLSQPNKVAYGCGETLFVSGSSADPGLPIVQLAWDANDPDSSYLTAFAGPATGLVAPQSLIFDRSGRLWVADSSTDEISRFDLPAGCVIMYSTKDDSLANTGFTVWATALLAMCLLAVGAIIRFARPSTYWWIRGTRPDDAARD
jgi:hypothetical protein